MASYTTLSDNELIALIRNNDHKAFTMVFDRYNKVLFSHVYNKLRDEESARDIVQDIFITLWEKRTQINDSNLAGYLFTLGRNRAINFISHHKVVSEFFNSSDLSGQVNSRLPDELIREKQLEAIIEAEISALPPRMREIFILSRYSHLSNKEIALKLNLSEHTVADQIKKSLRTLRTKIGLSVVLIVLGQEVYFQNVNLGCAICQKKIIENLHSHIPDQLP